MWNVDGHNKTKTKQKKPRIYTLIYRYKIFATTLSIPSWWSSRVAEYAKDRPRPIDGAKLIFINYINSPCTRAEVGPLSYIYYLCSRQKLFLRPQLIGWHGVHKPIYSSTSLSRSWQSFWTNSSPWIADNFSSIFYENIKSSDIINYFI